MTRRTLVVTADDFGIGPEVTRGILDLARAGFVTASVLLVNSPHAFVAVQQWRRELPDFELGWHPCLTLDRPLLPAKAVRSLIQANGNFWPLGAFLARLFTGRVDPAELRRELSAQLDRFIEWVGHAPTVVNGHHHIHVFPIVRDALAQLLRERAPTAYIRRVRESRRTLSNVQGCRLKRRFLCAMGKSRGAALAWRGFPTNRSLLGLANPVRAAFDADYFCRWLCELPDGVHELACHPGHADESLYGRDVPIGDRAAINLRAAELHLLAAPSFRAALIREGIELAEPRALLASVAGVERHAA